MQEEEVRPISRQRREGAGRDDHVVAVEKEEPGRDFGSLQVEEYKSSGYKKKVRSISRQRWECVGRGG